SAPWHWATTTRMERLRRSRGRCKSPHRSDAAKAPTSLPDTLPEIVEEEAPSAPTPPTEPGVAVEAQLGDSPVIVRQKLHDATPMTVDQALYEMELVGHPVYHFTAEAAKPPRGGDAR